MLKKIWSLIRGNDLSQARQNFWDEVSYNAFLSMAKITGALSEKEILQVEELEEKLREIDPAKAECFVLYIAQYIERFASKATLLQCRHEGRLLTEVTDLRLAVNSMAVFIKRLLEKPTMEEKINFLEKRNIFSLIPPSKEKKNIKEGLRSFDRRLGEIAGAISDIQEKFPDELSEKKFFGFRI